jgi:hypothetical protein
MDGSNEEYVIATERDLKL